MKPIVSLVLTLALIGCAKRVRVDNVVAATDNYAVKRIDETNFIIAADSLTTAKKVADEVLHCKKHPCIVQQGGVIVYVEQPEARGK